MYIKRKYYVSLTKEMILHEKVKTYGGRITYLQLLCWMERQPLSILFHLERLLRFWVKTDQYL